MKRIAFILPLTIAAILACGSQPTNIPEINVQTPATAVQISAGLDDTTGDDSDSTGASQSIQVDLPSDGKSPAIEVNVTPAKSTAPKATTPLENRKPDSK